MTRTLAWLAIFSLATAWGAAQQPNSPSATLKINGTDGPPFPIVNVFIFGGVTATIDILGGANVPFLLASTSGLAIDPVTNQPSGFPLFGGTVDLMNFYIPGQLEVIMDGFSSAPWQFKTDTSGVFSSGVQVPSNIQSNLTRAFQAVVVDPTAAGGLVLTAATSTITAPGVTHVNISYPPGADDNCVALNTQSQFGFTIPFYATQWTRCWVCANGFLHFGNSQNTDFTPSDAKMHSQGPKISPLWADLDPTVPASGPVGADIDQISPANPVVSVTYTHISDWPTGVNGGLAFHTFKVIIDISSGDITFDQVTSNASNYDMMIGISAGNSLDPTGAGSMNLSAQFAQGPYVAQVNEGMYEGFRGVTSITGTFPPTAQYDLAGNRWQYVAIGAGFSGASYIMQVLP